MLFNEASLDKERAERSRRAELDRKRVQVFLDQLKTLCFGFIGASAITPMFKTGDISLTAIGLGGWVVITISSFVLISMIVCADHVR